MKKLFVILAAAALAVIAVSCKKDSAEGDGRPVCTKIVFTVNSTGYPKEILDLFRINISGVDFDGNPFSSNSAAEYSASFTKEGVKIDSSEDQLPITIKVEIEKIAEPDPEESYTFPHSFFFQAEFYDAQGNKLDVSAAGPMADQKIDRVLNSQDDGTLTYKGKNLEREVRHALEVEETTYVFFRHERQDIFCCTTK